MDRNPYIPLAKVRHWSLSARRAWIEINVGFPIAAFLLSLSARRAWIEIIDDLEPSSTRKVALRKESVDRNSKNPMISIDKIVALRKESVDRNRCMHRWYSR